MHDQPHEAMPAAVGRERPRCYICGTTENLSKDHIPPKGFFPPNDYENFITAPLCYSCHSPFANMDEQMRVWISAGAAATSENAKWIWKNKVMNSTFKRSPKLRKYIAEKHFREMSVETPSGSVVADVMTMPQSQVHPFIRRLTKGFLYSFTQSTIILQTISTLCTNQNRPKPLNSRQNFQVVHMARTFVAYGMA
jgi:hypothetical protein